MIHWIHCKQWNCITYVNFPQQFSKFLLVVGQKLYHLSSLDTDSCLKMYIGSVVSRFLKLITIKTIGTCGSELWCTTDRYRNQCNSQVKFITILKYNCIGLKAPVIGVDAVYCSCDWFYCNSLPEIAPRAGFYRWSQLMST